MKMHLHNDILTCLYISRAEFNSTMAIVSGRSVSGKSQVRNVECFVENKYQGYKIIGRVIPAILLTNVNIFYLKNIYIFSG